MSYNNDYEDEYGNNNYDQYGRAQPPPNQYIPDDRPRAHTETAEQNIFRKPLPKPPGGMHGRSFSGDDLTSVTQSHNQSNNNYTNNTNNTNSTNTNRARGESFGQSQGNLRGRGRGRGGGPPPQPHQPPPQQTPHIQYTNHEQSNNYGDESREEKYRPPPGAIALPFANKNLKPLPQKLEVQAEYEEPPDLLAREDWGDRRRTMMRTVTVPVAEVIQTERSSIRGMKPMKPGTAEYEQIAANMNSAASAGYEDYYEEPGDEEKLEVFQYYNDKDELLEPDGAKAIALWTFDAQRETDLPFNKGDIITIVRRYSNGWWEGECNGVIGDFPCNFVAELEDEPDDDTDDDPTSSDDVTVRTHDLPVQQASTTKLNVKQKALPIKQGFLTKKGHKRRNWKVRYFVLEKHKLSYYAQPRDLKPKGVVPLHKSTLVKLAPEMKKSNTFTVSIPTKPYVFYIQAPTGEDMVGWMEAIQEAK